MNIFQRFKHLPVKKRNLLSIAIIAFLTVALPLFVWAIVTQRFNIGKRASTGEPGVCIPVNKVITVTPADGEGPCHNLQTAVNAVTGDGFRIIVSPGRYDIYQTINVANKNNITITGMPESGSRGASLNFYSDFGFYITNSSGSISWMSMEGYTPNGLVSIRDSNHFSITYAHMFSYSSHTFDSYNSTGIGVYNTEVQSSAGALEFGNVNGVSVGNNNIHNAANAVSVNDSQNIRIFGNLIADNRESAIRTRNTSTMEIDHNSIVNNTLDNYPHPQVFFAGAIGGATTVSNNIIAHGRHDGVKVDLENLQITPQITWSRNDVWNAGQEFIGIADPTGSNGNISEDPRVNSSPGSNYCLMSGSPAIWGVVANGEYMGYIGPCGSSPTSTPRPRAAECELCAGFAGIQCQPGLTCRMSGPNHPDQAGICVKTDGSTTCGGTPHPSANPNPPLCGQSTIPPATGAAPLTVTLHGSGNAGQGVGIQGYRWDFDNNGVWDTGIDINAITHTYQSPGTYNPKFQVRNINGIYSAVCDYGYPIVVGQSGQPQTLSFLVKFAGVTDDKANGAKVKIYLQTPQNVVETPPVTTQHQGNGVYKATFTVSNKLADGRYPLYIKGEKHIRIRFCGSGGTLTRCQGTPSATDGIQIDADGGTYDLTAHPLEPGDLYVQDGIADYRDFRKIITLMAKPSDTLTAQDKLTADLNYDGSINIRDAFMMRQTLSVRPDDF